MAHFFPHFLTPYAVHTTKRVKKWGKKCSTGQRFICTEVNSYKIHIWNAFQPNVKFIGELNLVKIPILCTDKETKTETKQEKSIRLGQMTAFGKVLTSKSNHDEDFIAKRKWEKDWMNSGEDSDDNIKKKRKVSKQLEDNTCPFTFFKRWLHTILAFCCKKRYKSSFSWPRFMLFPHFRTNLFIFT